VVHSRRLKVVQEILGGPMKKVAPWPAYKSGRFFQKAAGGAP